jgi:uncharacterized membrane protein
MILSPNNFITILWRLAVLFIVLVSLAPPAQAAMHYCNSTQDPIDAAIGYRDADGWVSEGWWNLKAGECVRVYGHPLTERFYFYYATSLIKRTKDDAPFVWSGKYKFCVDLKSFQISGDEDCESRGYETKLFQQIDIGNATHDYTLTFKDDGSGK